ncbi:hypothetical protein BIY24_08065 [Halobacteriovorax marinus]|uniref:substrate-binding periplasmic protein n=1 Tax=Halobacteriovorax marinus TaxID=97084 RepID=UPI000BC2E011|nr:transporter substrate-binding domain-containing protein [Halobacteriovorax marinus]ATH07905.1 hypothetical protein BIY24_08065 [Halobacteriovorax marinus]
MKLFALLLLFSMPLAKSEELHFAYGDHNSPPYIIVDRNKEATGGLLLDLAKFISKELGLKYTMVHTPRIRLEELLKKGDVDIYCNSNKSWVSNPDEFYWSEGIFDDANLLYTLTKEHSRIESTEEIVSKIGTIKGFSYHPEIEKLIDRVGRHDLKSHEKLLRFLQLGRVEIIVSSERVLKYYFKSLNTPFYSVSRFRDEFSYACIISKKAKVNINLLLASLKKFKSKEN